MNFQTRYKARYCVYLRHKIMMVMLECPLIILALSLIPLSSVNLQGSKYERENWAQSGNKCQNLLNLSKV